MNKNIISIREQTGCPYMIIKKALWAANDNVDEAIELLREKYGFGDFPKVCIKDWEIKYDKQNERMVQPRE